VSLERAPLSLVRITEELLERKVVALAKKTEIHRQETCSMVLILISFILEANFQLTIY
jgi:hypothetical protein